ncbi:hypothetical protein AVEN_112593-1 [Araneus ventricosus]|uniref:Uncharacterized protein n=1 Tax=Araneus ventricosus TaxID=182803 RepID=A0A4Y2L2W6_ARAVE|nr:hypothetical protein AVEN_112593-1 [Araneus ventricosus]
MDLHSVYRYANTDLLAKFQKQRASTDELANIFKAVKEDCKKLDKDIKIPRLAGRQTHRCNVQCSSPEDYFKVSVHNLCMDSIITTLITRFEKDKDIPFKGGILHPHLMRKEKKEDFMRDIQSFIKSAIWKQKPDYGTTSEQIRSVWKKQSSMIYLLKLCFTQQ